MQRSVMKRCRQRAFKSWLGAALTLWLLLAESFAITHQYDSAAHANGQACEVCVGAASFGAAAPPTPYAYTMSPTRYTASPAVHAVEAASSQRVGRERQVTA